MPKKSKTLTVLPNLTAENTLSLDPILETDRNDKEDPKLTASKMLKLDPNLTCEKVLIEEPNLEKPRKERVDPRCDASRIESTLPSRT
jgi:hypothetical protein